VFNWCDIWSVFISRRHAKSPTHISWAARIERPIRIARKAKNLTLIRPSVFRFERAGMGQWSVWGRSHRYLPSSKCLVLTSSAGSFGMDRLYWKIKHCIENCCRVQPVWPQPWPAGWPFSRLRRSGHLHHWHPVKETTHTRIAGTFHLGHSRHGLTFWFYEQPNTWIYIYILTI